MQSSLRQKELKVCLELMKETSAEKIKCLRANTQKAGAETARGKRSKLMLDMSCKRTWQNSIASWITGVRVSSEPAKRAVLLIVAETEVGIKVEIVQEKRSKLTLATNMMKTWPNSIVSWTTDAKVWSEQQSNHQLEASMTRTHRTRTYSRTTHTSRFWTGSNLFQIYTLHLPDRPNLTSVSHQISDTTAATTSPSMTMTSTSVYTSVVTSQSMEFHLTKEVLVTSLAIRRAKT